MGKEKERRLSCRLYPERPADKAILEKLELLTQKKAYANQNEIFKHGIELVYKEAFYDKEEVKELINQLRIELHEEFQEHDSRIIAALAVARAHMPIEDAVTGNGIEESGNSSLRRGTDVEETPKDAIYEEEAVEKAIPSQALSFLKGLNAD